MDARVRKKIFSAEFFRGVPAEKLRRRTEAPNANFHCDLRFVVCCEPYATAAKTNALGENMSYEYKKVDGWWSCQRVGAMWCVVGYGRTQNEAKLDMLRNWMLRR